MAIVKDKKRLKAASAKAGYKVVTEKEDEVKFVKEKSTESVQDQTELLNRIALVLEQNSAIMKSMKTKPSLGPYIPKQWNCEVSRNSEGYIESFSLKEVVN